MKETGGAAFPNSFSKDYPQELVGGMSLRDYFAAKALQGQLSAQSEFFGLWAQYDKLASYAYEIADAMITARGAQ